MLLLHPLSLLAQLSLLQYSQLHPQPSELYQLLPMDTPDHLPILCLLVLPDLSAFQTELLSQKIPPQLLQHVLTI